MIKSRCAGGGLSFDSNSRSTPLHLPLSHTQTQKIYCKILFFLLSLFVIVLSKPGWLEPGQAPATSVVSGQRNSSTDVSVSTSSRLYYVMPTIYIYIYIWNFYRLHLRILHYIKTARNYCIACVKYCSVRRLDATGLLCRNASRSIYGLMEARDHLPLILCDGRNQLGPYLACLRTLDSFSDGD